MGGYHKVIRKYLIPMLAVGGALLATYMVLSERAPDAQAQPNVIPPSSPYEAFLGCVGIIEASSRNIAVGVPVPGIIAQVAVTVGDNVHQGDPLLHIDDRAARAELTLRQAQLRAAEQMLSRLEAMPRPEELPGAEAKVAEAEAQLDDGESQLSMAESAAESIARKERSKWRYAVAESRARLAQARAELQLLKAGAWKEDVAVARAKVESARASVKAFEIDLERLTVRSPLDGEVLQVNIRPGEFAETGTLVTPLVILGDTRTLHVRVDVDENDAWRVRPEARACASLRGNSQIKTDLRFVRIEPYVVPKTSLTGKSTERVDTRVLQVLYSFPRDSLPVYVGQRMDVFIDASAAVDTDNP